MLKKIFITATMLCGFAAISNAQSYSFPVGNTADSTTQGSVDDVELDLKPKNITASETFKLKWTVISVALPDATWKFTSLCDNVTCQYNSQDNQLMNQPYTSGDVAPGSTALFRCGFNVPVTATNGQGIVKVKVEKLLGDQVDTMTFRLTKTPTGISVIKMNDNRVSVYPNPASNNNIEVYADKALNASKISLINIAGQVVMTSAVSKATEITNLNIHALSKGTYLVKLTDNNGKSITTRKFIKE